MENTSRAKLKLDKNRYRTWLERANDADCLTLIWAVNALQSGFEKSVGRIIDYPKEAVLTDMSNKMAVYKWELETIVTSLLTIPKDKPRTGKFHYTNLKHFGSITSLINWLRSLENGEYGLTNDEHNIWEEMYRIGQRQFSWQRGYNSEQLYRHVYVYGQGDCGAYFEEQNGLSVSTFIFLSLALFALHAEAPYKEEAKIAALNLPQSDMTKTLSLLSIGLKDARGMAHKLNADAVTKLRAPLKTAYMPSMLRQKPLIRIDAKRPIYIAPLPPLILNRATAGLYYDIKQGPKQLETEANGRFEEYIRKLVEAYHPRLQAIKGERYGRRGADLDPPDCLVKDGEQITAAIECKATKLTFEGQFAENPMFAAKQGFEQLAKGVFQLWRFFSHARRNIYTTHPVAANAHGVVLTMDNWMQMADKLREGAITRAKELAAADAEINEADMRDVVFASVQELNDTFAKTNTDEFFTVLGHAVTRRFKGYGLPEVAAECGVELTAKGFPLNVAELLPWWAKIRDPNNRLM